MNNTFVEENAEHTEHNLTLEEMGKRALSIAQDDFLSAVVRPIKVNKNFSTSSVNADSGNGALWSSPPHLSEQRTFHLGSATAEHVLEGLGEANLCQVLAEGRKDGVPQLTKTHEDEDEDEDEEEEEDEDEDATCDRERQLTCVDNKNESIDSSLENTDNCDSDECDEEESEDLKIEQRKASSSGALDIFAVNATETGNRHNSDTSVDNQGNNSIYDDDKDGYDEEWSSSSDTEDLPYNFDADSSPRKRRGKKETCP